MAIVAIKTAVRAEIMRALREDINYQVQDGDGGTTLKPTAIIWRYTRAQKDRPFARAQQLMDVPGLVVSEPFRVMTDTVNATNERDLWHYNFMIQLVDNDLWEYAGRIATWDKWMEQIVSAFHYSSLPNAAVTLPAGQIWWATATEVQSVDETVWVKEGKFITGIELEVRVSQPRGVIA